MSSILIDVKNDLGTRSMQTTKERKVPTIKICDSKRLTQYFKIGKKLGEGGYGIVMDVIDKSDSNHYAMKIISKVQASKFILDSIYRELNILKMVDHPHIIRLEKVFECPEKVYIVTEKCTGDLADAAFSKNFEFSEEETRKIIIPLASAVTYLHRNDIIHRDIKLENILLAENPDDPNDDLYIKLIDFGLSIVKNVASYNDMLRGACGTLVYMAPELINRSTYSQQCDVWAIGVLMYLLLEGRFPFFAKDEKAFAALYQTNNDISIAEFKASPEAVHLVRKMLTKNPALRITAAEIMQHPWVAGNSQTTASENVLDMMKLWHSDLKLPVGEQCDWVIELPVKAHADSETAVAGLSPSHMIIGSQLPVVVDIAGILKGSQSPKNALQQPVERE